jgi:hypothetical protein
VCSGAGARMPDALEYTLERPAFVDAFKAVQHTLICRSIGDANVYNAYFEKQCAEQNAQALALRASLETLTQLDDVVNDLVKQYLGMTHGKCQMLLDILAGIDSFDMRVFNGFAVCAIDGVIVRTGLCMRDKQTNVSFVISLKFKYFLFTFWLVKHFHSICLKRIVAFVKTTKRSESLQAVIEAFNVKYNGADDVYSGIFFWAYTVLVETLQLSVRKLRLKRAE